MECVDNMISVFFEDTLVNPYGAGFYHDFGNSCLQDELDSATIQNAAHAGLKQTGGIWVSGPGIPFKGLQAQQFGIFGCQDFDYLPFCSLFWEAIMIMWLWRLTILPLV